jgi:hypothetical protein
MRIRIPSITRKAKKASMHRNDTTDVACSIRHVIENAAQFDGAVEAEEEAEAEAEAAVEYDGCMHIGGVRPNRT